MYFRSTVKRKASTEPESTPCHKKQATLELGANGGGTPRITDIPSASATVDSKVDVVYPDFDAMLSGWQ